MIPRSLGGRNPRGRPADSVHTLFIYWPIRSVRVIRSPDLRNDQQLRLTGSLPVRVQNALPDGPSRHAILLLFPSARHRWLAAMELHVLKLRPLCQVLPLIFRHRPIYIHIFESNSRPQQVNSPATKVVALHSALWLRQVRSVGGMQTRINAENNAKITPRISPPKSHRGTWQDRDPHPRLFKTRDLLD